MNIKKRLKRFFTLTRRPNGGFTLVELIVVIAILAILAGVGTAGYNGYITSTNKNADKVLVGNIRKALDTANNSGILSFKLPNQYAAGLQIPVGYVLLSNTAFDDGTYVKMLTPGSVTGNGDGTFTSGTMSDRNAILEEAVTYAFGPEYAQTLKLKYSGWEREEEAAFFASAGEMVGSVKTMGDNVFWLTDKLGGLDANGDVSLLGKNVDLFSQDYNDSAHLMSTFAGHIANLEKDAFVRAWENVSTEEEAFGLNAAGREHYSAARAAYTNCVATYIEDQGDEPAGIEGTHDAHTHAAEMKNYGESAGELIASKLPSYLQSIAKGTINGYLSGSGRAVNFPKAVCAASFTGGSDFRGCEVCKKLTAQYQSSNTDTVDAEAFYDTMVTGAAEGIYNVENPNETEFFNWMTANANSFANMYNDVETYAEGKSVISVAVFYKDGLLQADVNPIEADPKKE